MSSAQELEVTFSKIIGLPLTDLWQALGQIFEFGEQKPFTNKKGQATTQADYSLKFLANWRVSLGAVTVFGSGDHRSGKRRFYDRQTPPRDPIARTRWRRAKEFLQRIDAGDLIVRSLNVSDSGLIIVALSDGYEIAGFGCESDWQDLVYWSDDADHSILLGTDDFCQEP